jgi:hypothetical protein
VSTPAEDFEELSAFLAAYAARFWGFGPEHPLNPANLGRESMAMFGAAQALAGMRQAVYAAVEDTQDLAPEQVAAFDAELAAAGVVRLSELKRRHEHAYEAVRARGAIDDEAEFHVVKGVLEHTAPILDAGEREVLEKLLRRFEAAREN